MTLKKLLYTGLFALMVLSCGKGDDTNPPTDTNNAPTLEAKTFNVSENISDTYLIGTITAMDKDGDKLTYTIATNSDGLFKIGATDGKLTLASGKQLDHATKAQHTIKVNVSDGTDNAQATVTINVTKADPGNTAPEISAQEFKPDEDITDAELIGVVDATDDGTSIQFSIKDETLQPFQIDPATGELKLKTGGQLDFEATATHTITVQVSDGELMAEAQITISVQDVNEPPGIDSNDPITATAPEDIADDVVIATITAEDPEGAVLQYSISGDESELFEINGEGQLTLQQGKALDYETAMEHFITVVVSDGELSKEITVQLTVGNVPEADPNDETAFVTTWETTMANEEVRIGVNDALGYNFTINWGDGSPIENYDFNNLTYISHEYVSPGTHQVAIQGQFPHIQMGYLAIYRDKLQSIDQWGTIVWEWFTDAFRGCSNMTYAAPDVPDLTAVTSTERMFYKAESFDGDLSQWDVTNILNMGEMFSGASVFNGNIDEWKVDNVTNMYGMFQYASSFNRDISGWNTGNVTSMSAMFRSATAFDQPIGGWDVSKVTGFYVMFNNATSFNRDLSGWALNTEQDVNINMVGMFQDAINFDQGLGAWNIANVKQMDNMLNNTALTTTHYDATLKGWAENPNTPNNIAMGAAGLTYCDSTGRDILVNDKSWTINGDIQDANCN